MKNYGFSLKLEQEHSKPEDWKFGSIGEDLAQIPEQERESCLPKGELQKGAEDFMDCATRSVLNILETKFNWLLKNKKFTFENEIWLREKGYLSSNGIEFSDRFIAIKSGTTREGNSLKAPLEAIRLNGLIPKALFPALVNMTFDQYHDPEKLTGVMELLGKDFASRFFINYEKVYEKNYGDLLRKDMLDVAGFAWTQPINGEYPNPGDEQPNHAFMVIKEPKYFIFDNYIDDVDGDWIKKLASDYNLIDYGYRISVNQNPISPKEVKSLLSLLNVVYQQALKLLELLKKKQLNMDKIAEFCKAIQKFEGWFPGSRSYRNNNPGNLKYTPYTIELGAVSKDDKNFCIFKTYETGFDALKQLVWDAVNLKLRAYRLYAEAQKRDYLTLLDFFSIYAPASDKNDPNNYALFVASELKTEPQIKLKDLFASI